MEGLRDGFRGLFWGDMGGLRPSETKINLGLIEVSVARTRGMNVLDIPRPLLDALDAAAGGRIGEVRRRCEAERWALDVTCVTHLEGLPEGDMKLRVTASDGARVTLFLEANVEGSARVLGWNVYLTERMAEVRRSLAGANRCLDRAREE